MTIERPTSGIVPQDGTDLGVSFRTYDDVVAELEADSSSAKIAELTTERGRILEADMTRDDNLGFQGAEFLSRNASVGLGDLSEADFNKVLNALGGVTFKTEGLERLLRGRPRKDGRKRSLLEILKDGSELVQRKLYDVELDQKDDLINAFREAIEAFVVTVSALGKIPGAEDQSNRYRYYISNILGSFRRR